MAVTAMDPEPDDAGGGEAAAQAAGVTRDACAQGSSYDLTPDMGPFRLVTMGRSFHWMDRAATLAMLDRIVAPGRRRGAVSRCPSPGVPKMAGSRCCARCRTDSAASDEPHIAEREARPSPL